MTLDSNLRDRLIELGRKLADERGWPWLEPVDVSSGAERGEAVWIISTNVLMRGQNVNIMLRRSDHSLVHAGYLPR